MHGEGCGFAGERGGWLFGAGVAGGFGGWFEEFLRSGLGGEGAEDVSELRLPGGEERL